MASGLKALFVTAAVAVLLGVPSLASASGYYPAVAVPRDARSFAEPSDVAVALDGTTFVADAVGGRVVALDASGNLVAVLDGEETSSQELVRPVAIDIGDDGLVYVADIDADRVAVFQPDGTFVRSWDGAAGAGGRLDGPAGIDVDAGLVYVSDSFRNRIQVFTAAGAYVRSFGLTEGTSGLLSRPGVLRVFAGELFVADVNSFRIQVYGTGGGWRRTWGVTDGGGSNPTRSRYQAVTGIEILSGGRVFITGVAGVRPPIAIGTPIIEECSTTGVLVGTWGGPPILAAPKGGVATAAGNLIFADSQLNELTGFDVTARTFSTPWGFAGSSQPGSFAYPGGVALTSDGRFYVADTANGRVQVFDRPGTLQSIMGTSGSGATPAPAGIDVSDDDMEIFVADTALDAIVVLAPNGDHLRTLGAGILSDPTAVFSVGNRIYIADTGANRIVKLNSVTGQLLDTYGAPGELNAPGGVAVDAGGRVYVSDTSNNRVVSFQSTTTPPAVVAGGGSAPGQVLEPGELAIDINGDLLVADRGNDRIQRLTAAGEFIAEFGDSGSGFGELREPAGVDANGIGMIAVADTGNHRAQIFGFDDLPPISQVTGIPGGYATAPVTVTLSAEDYESGMGYVRYRVGAGTETTYTTPFVISAQGDTQVWYRATDRTGNTEPAKLATVRIDSLPPSGTVTWAGGTSVIATTTLTLSADLVDAHTMRTRVSGGWSAEQPYIAEKTFALPGEGVYAVAAEYRDSLGNARTDVATVTVDRTAPSVAFGGVPASGASTGTVLVSVQTSDAAAGVAAVYLSVDGAAEQPYVGPISISTEGSHTVRARAVDGVGNASGVTVGTFAIDRTAPTGTIAPEGGSYFVQSPVFILIPAITGATEMRFEPGWGPADWSTYEPFAEFTFPGQGDHSLVAQFRDAAGNVRSFSESVSVDWTAPSSSASGLPVGGPANGEALIALAATDTYSGVDSIRYSLDGAASEAYSTPVRVTAEGPHTLEFSAADRAGNREATRTVEFTVFTEFPVSLTLSGGRSTVATRVVSVDSSSSGAADMSIDAGAGFGAWMPFDPQVDVTLPGEGFRTVKVRYRSDKGSVVEFSDDIIVDWTAPGVGRPTVTPSALRFDGSWLVDLSFAWQATDAGSGLYRHVWRFGSTPGIAGTPSVSIPSVPKVATSFVADSIDAAGNRSRVRRGVITGVGSAPSVPPSASSARPARVVVRVGATGRSRFVLHGFRQGQDGTWVRELSTTGRPQRTPSGALVAARPYVGSGTWRFILETVGATTSTFGPPSVPLTVQ